MQNCVFSGWNEIGKGEKKQNTKDKTLKKKKSLYCLQWNKSVKTASSTVCHLEYKHYFKPKKFHDSLLNLVDPDAAMYS